MTFKSEPPTKPGAYWWKSSKDKSVELVQLKEKGEWLYFLDCDGIWKHISKLPGEWSPRLVPVDEVEKAWHEGFDVLSNGRLKSLIWSESRAKQVVEGEV